MLFRLFLCLIQLTLAGGAPVSARLWKCIAGLSDVASHDERMERLAKAAGLHYASDDAPGITRRRRGKGFVYYGPDRAPITDEKTIVRIDALGIPPAYAKVWISPDPKSHLQATGLDERGRKQYRYHPKWEDARDAFKFHRTRDFGLALPRIRARVAEDLKLPASDKRRVLATVARLLEETLIRVGNEHYAEENDSFGLTTLRRRHVTIDGTKIRFDFVGKSQVHHTIEIRDPKLVPIIEALRERRRGALFQVTSDEVNDYLREASGQEITAKDFRTWFGTVTALRRLHDAGPGATQDERAARLELAFEAASGRLGNTPTVCRESYVHPIIVESYGDGRIADAYRGAPAAVGLSPDERAALYLLDPARR